MAAVTPVQSAPYPLGSDPPNGPAQIQALATWAETLVVMRFASASARDTALGSAGVTPVAGMCAYLADGDAYSHYNGSAWTLVTVGSEMGRNIVAGSTGTSASFVKVTTGVKVTITLPTRRKLAVDYALNGSSATGTNHANSCRGYLTRRTGSGDPTASDPVIDRAHANFGDAGVDATCAKRWPDTLDPGTYTYGLMFEARGGTGHKDDDGGSAPAFIAVYDAGPG